MSKKKTRLDRFSDLTWNDIEAWAGGKIVSRGKNYQCQGRVSDLAVTVNGRPDPYSESPFSSLTRVGEASLTC